MRTNNDFCVILAGGVGRRLWPSSRVSAPKQFMDFFGCGQTLIQQTYRRIARFIPRENIFVSTFKEYDSLVREQLPDLPADNLLLEPVQLSTAPAVAWATYHISRIHPDANMVVTPADQYIADEQRFEEQIARGLDFVATHPKLLAIGAKPVAPNTGYGYIQKGEDTPDEHVYTVKSFTEKPDLQFAQVFVESGEFVWNTGIFLWNVRTMTKRLDGLIPVVGQRISEAGEALTNEAELELVERYYPSTLHMSIDLVILERSDNVFVQETDFGWADVGSWPEVHELHRKDVDGNAVVSASKTMLSASRDNLIALPSDMALVLHGLEGYLVAQKGNVLVICPNSDPALVRRLANEAQMQFGEDYM